MQVQQDVVIVGGGIGGCVLAALLGRAGRAVTVLERSTGPPPWTRPEILWPRTADVLFSLLPQAEWESHAVRCLEGLDVFAGGRFVPAVTPERFEHAGVRPWSTDPNATREQLLSLGGEGGDFELRRGVEVLEVLQEGGRVVGVRAREGEGGEPFDVLADWTIGDDGGNSIVRRACGIDMAMRLFPVEFFCFRFDWPETLRAGAAHVVPNLAGVPGGILAVGGTPLPDASGAGIVVVRGDALTGDDKIPLPEVWGEWRDRYPITDAIVGPRRFPEDFARVRRYWGHAKRYGAPGAVLIGDAAHPPSPAGGQGANMSVADAFALAECCRGNVADPVGDFERLRRPANARSLQPTRVAQALLGLPGWARSAIPVRFFARHVGSRRPFTDRMLRFLSSAAWGSTGRD